MKDVRSQLALREASQIHGERLPQTTTESVDAVLISFPVSPNSACRSRIVDWKDREIQT